MYRLCLGGSFDVVVMVMAKGHECKPYLNLLCYLIHCSIRRDSSFDITRVASVSFTV
jgi:hypothetical protein